jgi:hypothetical protein
MGSLCPWISSTESVDWCRLATSPLTALRVVLPSRSNAKRLRLAWVSTAIARSATGLRIFMEC